jgi:hypothetical protein
MGLSNSLALRLLNLLLPAVAALPDQSLVVWFNDQQGWWSAQTYDVYILAVPTPFQAYLRLLKRSLCTQATWRAQGITCVAAVWKKGR